jgi:predicted Rossmann fold flavoprotein
MPIWSVYIKTEKSRIIVIGGGAAGFFSAIQCARLKSVEEVLILEQSQQVLSKVKISGGGRCNVTHACFSPKELILNYPRGSKELLSAFHRFQPQDTIDWFKDEGVELKTEKDGRLFPMTNRSQTIVDALMEAAKESGVKIRFGNKVNHLEKTDGQFIVHLKNGEQLSANKVMLSTGSSKLGYELAESLGHTIIPALPSLFTFNIPDSPLHHLSGISVLNARVKLPEFNLEKSGPLLITHWGFSGPAVLKLSAFAAIDLANSNYSTVCEIDWLPELNKESLRKDLKLHSKINGKKRIFQVSPFCSLPKKLWRTLLLSCCINETLEWRTLTKDKYEALLLCLKKNEYSMKGKATYKKEFVSCGGIKRDEIDFRTMESKVIEGLFLGGEILDIDGITGGFNFQAAWTTGWIAGNAMGKISCL